VKRLAICISAALVLLGLGSELTAPASALPDQHVVSGSYPFTGEGVAKGENVVSLSTALSAPLTASEIKLSLECKELGSLCPYNAHLTGARFEGKTCHTAGDAEGTILVTGNEAHLVWLRLSIEGELLSGLDFLMAKLTVTCVKGAESLKITIEGQLLGKLEGPQSNEATSAFTIDAKCTNTNNGKQGFKEYFNDEGMKVKGTLKANLGLGPETACGEISTPVSFQMTQCLTFLNITSESSSSLPEQHLTLGGCYPYTAEGTRKGANISQLSTALLGPLTTGEEVKALLECQGLGSKCLYSLHFVGMEVEGKRCSTEGDEEGALLLRGYAHLVWLRLAGEGGLLSGIDFLVGSRTITCVKGVEKVSFVLSGQLLAKLEAVNANEEVTSFTLNIKCTKPNSAKQEFKEYFNAAGVLVSGVLSFGVETACEEIKEPIAMTANKMIEFLKL
jgi:hypothetical protein